MATIKVLVVGDGPWMDNNPPQDGINFAPSQDKSDGTFTVSEFVYLLKHNAVPSIAVDTAHRRDDPSATFPKFTFTPAALAPYDVIWLFGYEGWNYPQAAPPGGPIQPTEVEAINAFMAAGGGVFATGDHAGMGSFMCGAIPRVRTMRKWFARSVDLPTGYPSTALNYAGASVTTLNWPGISNDPNPGVSRADTLQRNPSDTAAQFAFDDQSDGIPQQLTSLGAIAHPILRGPNGPLLRYPDHMHEGETVTPADLGLNVTVNTESVVEYPSVGGYQPAPTIIATGTTVAGHTTTVDQATCDQPNFTGDFVPNVANTLGTLCTYDGRGANVGRIVTDGSFHHFLDLNLVGDPCGSTPDRMAGFGAALTPPAAGSVLADLQAFYVNTVVWLARPDLTFYFTVDKSTFGFDEASDASTFPQFANAFWLVIDGYSLAQVQAAVNANALQLSGAFAAIPAIKLSRGAPAAAQGQRVVIPYSVQFAAASLGAFPTGAAAPVEMLLAASVTLGGKSFLAETTFELVAGANPYFVNVNPQENNAFYLSQDLCVFTVNAGPNPFSVPDIPVQFSTTNPTGQDPGAARTFITNVLSHMNGTGHFTDPGSSNPFASFPTQSAASGDSSVTPATMGFTNYNFAIARVRLSGPPGSSAAPVKVFFRLFLTQTNDTDYQPSTSYLSSLDASGDPAEPQPAPDGESTPFYASGSGATDYAAGGPNDQTITVGSSGSTSRYYGCFLDVYNGAFNWKAMGTHHCLVAQIAYDGAPIVNANGITASPDNTDKLAQRNLQITSSGNPGGADAHRVPQTFDVRPSGPLADTAGELLDYPDELMIDWGNTPRGTVASIYWPQVDGLEVIRLASRLSGNETLALADPHTVQCTVDGNLTFVPIPSGGTQRFAGLLTVDLPMGITKGQEFNIVVRRLSSRRLATRVGVEAAATDGRNLQRNWRYVVGTFQVKIPVADDALLLPAEETTYAILLWRLSLLSPSSRWYPVMQRYVSYVAARVNAFGGNAGAIKPSPIGIPYPGGAGPGAGSHHGARLFTGKVIGLVYDRFGDFEGFELLTEEGHEHAFHATEVQIEERVRYAWTDRVVISVLVHESRPRVPISIILRRKP